MVDQIDFLDEAAGVEWVEVHWVVGTDYFPALAVVPSFVAVADSAWVVLGFGKANFVALDCCLDQMVGVKVENRGRRLVGARLKDFVLEAVHGQQAGGLAYHQQTEIGRNLGDAVEEVEGLLVAWLQGPDSPDLHAVEMIG